MRSISCYSLFLIFTIISHSCYIFHVNSDHQNELIDSPKRETLEIIIGGGGGGGYSPPPDDYGHHWAPPRATCPEPPPPPPPKICPPPPPPPPPSPPPIPYNIRRDAKTIRDFGKTITCDPLNIRDSWKGDNACKYKGFACDTRPDKGYQAVAAADFNGYGFAGPNLKIKDFVDKLFDLAIFHANSNNFSGPVPDGIKIDNINFFYEFDISNNKYTGGFPNAVLGARNLTFVDIRFNQFSGPIPGAAFNLDLDVLFLNNNNFDQKIPENLGDTPALYLTFANNKFTGQIPKSLGRAKNLLEVLFLNNELDGCLPVEIGNLKKMTVFDASCNKLTGPIPYSFGCLAKIEILNLAKNQLYGPVPEVLCKLPNLKNLSLSGNYFTQVGPECRKKIKLKYLDVRKNCILGLPDQRSENECTEFFKKKFQCPNEKTMTYIPCKNYWYLNKKSHFDEANLAQVPAASPPRSYDALSPDNKLRF